MCLNLAADFVGLLVSLRFNIFIKIAEEITTTVKLSLKVKVFTELWKKRVMDEVKHR